MSKEIAVKVEVSKNSGVGYVDGFENSEAHNEGLRSPLVPSRLKGLLLYLPKASGHVTLYIT